MASRRSTASRLSLVVAAALSLTVGATQVAAGAECTTAWTVQTAPGLPAGAEVAAIAGLSASEAWAVGGGTSGLLAHFIGGSWTSTRYTVTGRTVSLASIDAGPAGGVGGRLGHRRELRGARAGQHRHRLAAGDGSLGGRRCDAPLGVLPDRHRRLAGRIPGGRPVALRWDGTRLRLLTVPFTGFAAAVEAPLTGGLILAGQSGRTGHPPQAWRRTGSTWVQDRMPAPASSDAALLNIDSARGAIWAGGWGRTSTGGATSFVYRWTGIRWAANSPPAGNAALSDVLVGRADGHVVAVGEASSHAVIWDWNGTSWQQVAISGLDPAQPSAVTNIDGDGQGNRWASGSQGGRPLGPQQCAA